MKYTCPVCGYPNLEDEPKNHEICPSCGTEFGYEDLLRSHESLRNEWFAKGAKWFLEGYEPRNWNPYLQLSNLQPELDFNAGSLSDDSIIEFEDIGKLEIVENNVKIHGSLRLIKGGTRNLSVSAA